MLHWLTHIWRHPLENPLSYSWLAILYTFGWTFVGYILEIRLNKEDKHKLKDLLKNKGLAFEVSNPIHPENLTLLIHRLYKETEYYLDKECLEYPIKYYPQTNTFKIFYNGKLKAEKQILKIVIKHFKQEFSIKALI